MTTPRTLQYRMVIGVLALIGLLVAVHLSLNETGLSNNLACLGGGSGCETVNQSEYVHMFGIPIAVIGMIGYGIILALDLGWMTRREVWRLPLSGLLAGLTGFGFLFSLYLTYLELFKIRAICTWCVVSALLMTAMLVLALLAWPAERDEREKPRRAR